MKLRHWLILFLFTGLITTACKTRQNPHVKAGGRGKNNTGDTTNTNANQLPDTTKIAVIDTNIVKDTSGLVVEGDTTKPKRKSPLEDKVDYKSQDSIVFDVKNKVMYLYDTAQINYQTIELKANYVEIDLNKKELKSRGVADTSGKLIGKPVFTDNGQSFNAKEMNYNFESKKGLIKEAVTNQDEVYLHAEVAKKDSNDVIYVKNAKFTTCTDPDHPHFYIKTSRGKVVKDKVIVTGPAYLSIADVPTPLILPFGYFPDQNKRSSGIILPQYGEYKPYGFFLRGIGYHFAINDKLDLDLVGDIYSSLSFGVRSTLRYNQRYKFNGQLDLGFSRLHSGDPEVPSEYRVAQDFAVKWVHNTDPKANPTISFKAQVDVQSGGFNINNSANTSNIIKNQFASTISFSKTFRNTPLSMSLSASHSQNTANHDLIITLPEFVFNVLRFNPFKRKKQVGELRWYENIGMTYSMNIVNRMNTKDTLLTKDPLTELGKMNNGIRQTISINTNLKVLKYFNLTPTLSYTEKWHFANLQKFYNASTLKVEDDTLRGFFSTREMNANMTLTTILYGMYTFRGNKVRAIRHVITPTIQANFRPDLGDQITGYFGPSGELISYSPNQIGVFGASPSGMSGTVGFNISNNLEMKVASKRDTVTGTKKISLIDALDIAMLYDFAKDSINLSPLTIRGRTTLFNSIVTINYAFAFDPYAYQKGADGITRQINDLSWKHGQGPMRLTNATLNIGFGYKGQSKKTGQDVPGGLTEAQRMIANNPMMYDYVDFNVPYSFNIGYNIAYTKMLDIETITHAISFSGDLSITRNWKIMAQLNYDIQNNQVGQSKISLLRDLHCWEMSVDISPFGIRQYYMFTIRVKSPLLQMMKLQRQSGNTGAF